MLDMLTTFFIQDFENTNSHFDERGDLIRFIMRLFIREKQTILEVSDMIPVRDKEDAAGFFADIDYYTDIVATKNRFRFVEGNTADGVTVDRYILAPAEQDISDAFFKYFAYGLADRIIKEKAGILKKRPRDEYVKSALRSHDILVDVQTLAQIARMVQKEYLEIYHRMWSM